MAEILSVGHGLPPGIFVPLPDAPRRPLPLDGVKVSAGFPSPAADYEDARLDINDYLVRNPVSTFFFAVQGDSMQGAEIFDGDILVVDRSIRARHGHVVVAFINGERLGEAPLSPWRPSSAGCREPGLSGAGDSGRHGPRGVGGGGWQVQALCRLIPVPIFALVDCNNFYASCEKLFNPTPEGPPGRRPLEQRWLCRRTQRRGQGARHPHGCPVVQDPG